MALTLAQAKELSQDKLTNEVIDEFRTSPIMDALVFEDTVKPQGGKSLSYVYNRVTTQPTAGTRAINYEYTAQEAITEQQVVNLKVMGGAYEIDRVIAEDERQVVDHIQFQTQQKAKATKAVFHDQFINGDSATTPTDFDGIDKAVAGSTTEINAPATLDLSSSSGIDTGYKEFLYLLRQLTKNMDGEPTHYIMNADLYAVFQSIADVDANVRYTKDEMGKEILKYGEGILVKMGDKAGTTDPIIETDSDGKTTLYAIRMGRDGVHGVTPDGTVGIKTYLPDLQSVGAVKKGEVEFVGAIAVKTTKSVGAVRGIKVGEADVPPTPGD